MKRYVLGITGGIAAGKSTLSAILSAKGAHIIDADKISASILKKGNKAYDKVLEVFPSCFIDGKLNRRALGRIVFNDPVELEKLNGITHPAIIDEIKRQISADEGLMVIDAALLFETGLDALCGKVWCVTAQREVRIKRIINRDGLSREDAVSRIESQMSDEERSSRSDVIFDTTFNDDPLRYNEFLNLIDSEYSAILEEFDR